MQTPQPSSNEADELDEAALAVLVACQHRGPLTLAELLRMIPNGLAATPAVARLIDGGLLEVRSGRHAVTPLGMHSLDNVLESVESQLTPDAPEYLRRYRREAPSLPFDTNAVWAEAVAVNFRVDPQELRPLIPDPFDLDLYAGAGFVSLLASRLKDFGMGKLPGVARTNFYQATYRAHVTYTDFRGRTTRGCFFLRSETNSALMSLSANMLPEFRAHHCATSSILMARQAEHLILTVDPPGDPAGKVVLVLDTGHPRATMPGSSSFPSIQAAREFLVDITASFSYQRETDEVYILGIDRGEWDIRIMDPVDHYLGYFNHGPFYSSASQLDSVFYFTDVAYRWLPLVKEKLKHRAPG
jgi:hypothetical protein